MTGNDLGRHLDTKISHSYTNFLDATKKNRLFREALTKVVEERYKGILSQKSVDDIDYLIKTGLTLVPNSNKIYTAPLQITSVTNVTTTVTVTTYLPHNLVSLDSVVISGISGFTTNNPNGTFSVTVTSTTSFTYTVGAAPTGSHTANTGIVKSATKIISDYWHLLSMKAKYERRYYDITIEDLTFRSPIVMTVDWWSRLRKGSRIKISGALGNTNANTTAYLKKLTDKTFALYSDDTLQTKIAGNGYYTTGALLSEVFYEQAKPYYPITKIGVLNIPTEDAPRWENADNQIKIYPLDKTCTEVTIDYIRKPDVEINTSDTAIDLEDYYSARFLYYLVDVAMGLYAQASRDNNAVQYSNLNQQQN